MRPYRPLRGVRVLAFELAFSLPAGTRTLAELGAEVVRIVRPGRGGPRGSYITVVDGTALSKASVTIDLATERGRDLARCLVTKADAVCCNFLPSVMPRFGLDYDSLRAIKPDIIMLQLTGYGAPGPWSAFPAYGPSTEAAGGMNQLTGEPDDPPMRVGSGVFADQAGGRYAALALLAALVRRQRTGEGCCLDLSMAESISHLLGDKILRAAAGEMPARHGNRDPRIAPQGVYPCDGHDEWLAISIVTDAQWRALVDLVGDPALRDPEIGTVEGRRRCHDMIDHRIAAWTRPREKQQTAAQLQARGIPAGPVQKTSDLPFDPHLAARGAFHSVRHTRPILGYAAHPHLTTPWQATGRRRAALEDIHDEGEDNRRVLRRWLGLTAAEIRRLEQDGALAPVRQIAVPAQPPPVGAPVFPDFAERLGLPGVGS